MSATPDVGLGRSTTRHTFTSRHKILTVSFPVCWRRLAGTTSRELSQMLPQLQQHPLTVDPDSFGTISAFGFTTPVPYPYGVERNWISSNRKWRQQYARSTNRGRHTLSLRSSDPIGKTRLSNGQVRQHATLHSFHTAILQSSRNVPEIESFIGRIGSNRSRKVF